MVWKNADQHVVGYLAINRWLLVGVKSYRNENIVMANNNSNNKTLESSKNGDSKK